MNLNNENTHIFLLRTEYYSDCSIIPLEDLKQTRKKSLEYQLENEKERKKNQKI